MYNTFFFYFILNVPNYLYFTFCIMKCSLTVILLYIFCILITWFKFCLYCNFAKNCIKFKAIKYSFIHSFNKISPNVRLLMHNCSMLAYKYKKVWTVINFEIKRSILYMFCSIHNSLQNNITNQQHRNKHYGSLLKFYE